MERESDSPSENDSEKRGKQGGERNMKRRCKQTGLYSLSTPNKKSQDKGTDPKKNPNSSQYLRQKSKNKCELPVTCGDKKGIFYVEKYNKEQKCILSEGQWFKPSEFERFGGKERNKKWKTSIHYNGIPLQKLTESCQQLPYTSESSGSDDDVEEEDDDDDDDDDVDEDDDDDLTVFDPTLPVTCASKSGMLHKCRFATGLTFSSGPLTEELQCSVCLDVFTEPVTIPCGHNFCKSCLNQCWDKSEACCCPLCKETFSKRPDLKINTALRQVVQLFKEKSCLTKPDVLCDICDERKLKALKSCLICQSSYCETHLEPHQRVPRLKKHKLINAVENLEDYICQKHERPLELFCRDDQTLVCLFCTDGDHKTHNTVPLEEESEEKKAQVMKIQTEVQQIIQDRMKKIQDIKHSAELRKQNTEKEIAESIELFTAMIRSIEQCQAERLGMMEQKQEAAEKQEEKLIEELQKEITELKLRNTELEQLSHTEDHLHLLQIYPSLRSPFNIKKWPDINVINTHPSLETLRKALTRLQKTIDEKLSENGPVLTAGTRV